MPRIVKAPANVVKAAANGKVGVLRAWLSSDAADVNAANRAGDTLLMIAAQHEQVVELLLQHGAEINKQNSKGLTTLMFAADYGHERVVELLLQHGAEINKRDSEGFTALMLAAGYGWTEIVLLLLRAGADTTSALQLAADSTYAPSRSMRRRRQRRRRQRR